MFSRLFGLGRFRNVGPKLIDNKTIGCLQNIFRPVTGNIPPKFHLTNRRFHVSNKKYAPPPIILLLVRAATNIGVVLFKKHWKRLHQNKKGNIFSKLKNNKDKFAACFALFAGVVYFYQDSHTSHTPITKRKRFIVVTDEQIKEIARSQYLVLRENYEKSILPSSSPYVDTVTKIINKLIKGNLDIPEVKNYQWSITVVEDEKMQNAFVLPSGDVFVFTGMVDICSNEDQLAIILAHEMAHCLMSHGAELLSYAHLVDLIVIIPLAALWLIMPNDGVAVISHWFFKKVCDIMLHLPYSRRLETEADMVGLDLAAKSCYDIREAPAFWNKMSILNHKKGDINIEWLSTHPTNEARMSNLNSLVPAALTLRSSKQCPALPRVDPRAGLPELSKLS